MIIARRNWDQFFMYHAHLYATRSTCDRGPRQFFSPNRHGVGAVIVKDKMVIAGGYNGAAPGLDHCDDEGHLIQDTHCVRTIHAEANALIQCAKLGISTWDTSLYTTASPCFNCAKLIARAGITKVVYADDYRFDKQAKELFEHCRIELIHKLS